MYFSFDESYGKVGFDKEKNIVFVSFEGKITHEDYKQVWHALINEAVKHQCFNVYIDQSNVEKVGMESRAWVIANWLPRAKKELSEDTKVAVLSARQLFARFGGEYIANAASMVSSLNIRFFSTKEDAENWLKI